VPQPDPKTILVLGLMGRYPMAGVAWQAMQYLLGLSRLGYEVYYAEDSGAPPYNPELLSVTIDPAYNLAFLEQAMARIGLPDRWVYWDEPTSRYHGFGKQRLFELYARAGSIWNICGATRLRDEHHQGARLVYVETDPVVEQLRVANGDRGACEVFDAHDVLFTYGENLGGPDCPVPLVRFAWRTTRPPVVVEEWAAAPDPGAAYFTSIASWENRGKDVTFRGETWRWSKHENFLRFIELPRRVPQRFRLAMDPVDPAVCARLEAAGWGLTDPALVSGDVDAYRRFIRASRGEFTVAKDIYVRPRSGWFSDRSACYLAAGKPVVTQDTGFGRHVPTGNGLFAFSTLEEAADALARIDADYVAQSRAARGVAEEHFAAGRVLGRLLAEAGLG
jgi:hypothetical protein